MRYSGVLLLLLLAGCGGCGGGEQAAAPADPAGTTGDTFTLDPFATDTAAGEGIITDAQGEVWSGAAGTEVRLTPGTRLLNAAMLRTGAGTCDLFFPGRGVARLLSGTVAEVSWRNGVPRLILTAGTAGVLAGGNPEAGLCLQGGRAEVTVRAGQAALRVTAAGCEVAVASGDAQVAADERLQFVNMGDVLWLPAGEEPGSVSAQGEVWQARWAELEGITHADEFRGLPRAVLLSDTPLVPVRVDPARGLLAVRRVSALGTPLTGSCRIYDQTRDRDLFGTTFDFPRDMPVRLPAGTYVVELAYTDVVFPPRENVVVSAGETAEVVFGGCGRLELRRGIRAEGLLYYRIYDETGGRELTRSSLELPPGGSAIDLPPGTYRVEFRYGETPLPALTGITVAAGTSVAREVAR